MAEGQARLPREAELDFTSATRSRLGPYRERDRFIHRFPEAENARLKAPEELQRAARCWVAGSCPFARSQLEPIALVPDFGSELAHVPVPLDTSGIASRKSRALVPNGRFGRLDPD